MADGLMVDNFFFFCPLGEGKYSVYCRVPSKGVGDKPQIHSNLVFELGGFFKGKNKEAGINHRLVTFVNCCFRSPDISGYDSPTRWSTAGGVC